MGAEMTGVGSLVTTCDDIADRWTGKYEVEIFTDEEHAIYMEFGTKPHPIQPDTANALRFRVDGVTVITDHVDHPGTEPRPFMQPAAEAAARGIEGETLVAHDLESLARRLGNRVKEYAKSYAPKDTGELAADIRVSRIR